MLGKNNYKERLRKMELQAKQDRFSIRKLTIGAASVLLGFTFLGLSSQTVKADTDTPAQNLESKVETKSNESDLKTTATDNKEETTLKSNKVDNQTERTEKEPKLSTFSGLTSFLKSNDQASKSVTKTETAKDQEKKDVKDAGQANTVEQPETNANDSSVTAPEKNDSISKDTVSNITAGNNVSSDSKLPEDSQSSVDKPDNDASSEGGQNGDIDKTAVANDKIPILKDAGNGISYKVSSWQDFQNALYNQKITEIVLMNDISAASGIWNTTFSVPGRDLLIRSDANNKYTLNFTGYAPIQTAGTNANVTFQNINIKSNDFYGVWDTLYVSGSFHTNIVFNNCTFRGTQLIYSGDNTHIYFTGNNDCQNIKTSNAYNNQQQLFEFRNTKNNSIDFLDGEFTGSTYGGTIIEMKSNGNTLKIHRGATVNLIPAPSI